MIKKFAFAAALLTLGTATAQADEHIKLLLDWFVNPNHASIFAAEYSGAFKRAGLDVEIVPPADPSVPPRLLAAGQADLALSYQPQLYMLVDKGLPVERVGTIINTPLNTIAAIEGGPIKTMKDFKGHKIGYSVGGLEDVTIRNMLKFNGVDPKDVELVAVNFQVIPALLTRQVDGAIAVFRNFETTELKEKGATPIVFKPEENGVPAYDELIVLANKVHAHDAKIQKFMAALAEGTTYLKAHPDETWNAFAKAYPDLNNDLNKTAWNATLPLIASNPMTFDRARYEAFAQYMKKNDLIDAVKPLEDYGYEPKP
jgi:putative hydroxymethylpyrimidine transport system substrate-binding protein